MSFTDLHTHSTYSDGTLSPARLLRYAKEKGLSAVALTDHDNMEGFREAYEESLSLEIEFIPGIEMSAAGKNKVHIIGLFINPEDGLLRETVNRAGRLREARNVQIVEALQKADLDISFDELQSNKNGSPTRANIAAALMKKGYASSIGEAFERYLHPGGKGYVKSERASARDIIEAIGHSGGVSVLCHINQIKADAETLFRITGELKGYGLDAVETFYPEYDDYWRSLAHELSSRFSLLESGGSDYHAKNYRADLGFERVAYNILTNLKKRHESKGAGSD